MSPEYGKTFQIIREVVYGHEKELENAARADSQQ